MQPPSPSTNFSLPWDVRPSGIGCAGRLSVKIVKNGTLKVYPGHPHCMLTIHADVINPDLLAFIQA